MKKPMTMTEFASLGGHARAAKLTPEQRRESARKAGKASAAKRKEQHIVRIFRDISGNWIAMIGDEVVVAGAQSKREAIDSASAFAIALDARREGGAK